MVRYRHNIYHTEERRFVICQIVITVMVGITGIIGPDGTVQHLPSQEMITDANVMEQIGP